MGCGMLRVPGATTVGDSEIIPEDHCKLRNRNEEIQQPECACVIILQIYLNTKTLQEDLKKKKSERN